MRCGQGHNVVRHGKTRATGKKDGDDKNEQRGNWHHLINLFHYAMKRKGQRVGGLPVAEQSFYRRYTAQSSRTGSKSCRSKLQRRGRMMRVLQQFCQATEQEVGAKRLRLCTVFDVAKLRCTKEMTSYVVRASDDRTGEFISKKTLWVNGKSA